MAARTGSVSVKAMASPSFRLIKHAHACVELQRDEQRIVVDPGTLGEAPGPADCTAVLVSHGHFDHAGRDPLEAAVAAGVPVFGPSDLGVQVGSPTVAAGLTVLAPGDRRTIGGFDVAVLGGRHARVHPERLGPENLSFLIDGRVLITGDQHPRVSVPIELLVTAVDAPWLRAVDLIEYVRSIEPATVLGVHDGLLNETGLAVADAVLQSLTAEGAGRALRLGHGQHLDLDPR